jgi:hypothetical protein
VLSQSKHGLSVQTATWLKSTVPPENRAALKSTLLPENSALSKRTVPPETSAVEVGCAAGELCTEETDPAVREL